VKCSQKNCEPKAKPVYWPKIVREIKDGEFDNEVAVNLLIKRVEELEEERDYLVGWWNETSNKPHKGGRWQAVDANWLAKLNLILKRMRDRGLDD